MPFHGSALLAALLTGCPIPVLPQGPAAPAPPTIHVTEIVTATVQPAPETSTARAVTVLTQTDLARLGISSPVDALRFVPGVDVRARGPMQVQADFSMRGSTFGQNLILVDGIRLNDAQTGHHNGEIPLPVVGIDRIEVVGGAASAVHGADALGGAINVLTDTQPHAALDAAAGQHGFGSIAASIAGHGLPAGWALNGWGQRSDGFEFDREFALGGGAVRGPVGRGVTFDVRHQRRAFGANGFYGPSPSKEWTDLTLVTADWQRSAGSWSTSASGTWKNHGDHFRWDINRPGFAESQHRTNGAQFTVVSSRATGRGASVSLGADGGADLVRSNNLGDHDFSHAGVFAELRAPLGARAAVTGGLRAERYTTFGSTVSPSLASVLALGRGWRVRASAAHAFRVPTFTELYYHDPASLGTPTLEAEHGWTADAGVDVQRGAWTLAATPFVRWDKNVIDWVRPTPADLWRSTNIRDVTTTGIESSIAGHWRGRLVRAAFTRLNVIVPALDELSKYVLEYARDSFTLSGASPLGQTPISVSFNADYRHRLDGQRYTLLDARATYAWKRASAYVAASNLLNEEYHEIQGVTMPGRWVTVGVTVR